MAKDRPTAIYREERLTEKKEWVCVRQTFDIEQFKQWRALYAQLCTGPDGPPEWLKPRKYARGVILWQENV